MLERFKAFLELAFRDLVPTKESEEYKAELLGILMDRAEEMKNGGESDEDVIYKRCIDHLGDFKENFVNFKKVAPINSSAVVKAVKKTAKCVMWAGLYMLVVVAIFLIVSFTVGPWSKTWLIPVCGALVGLIGVLVYSCVVAAKNKWFLNLRVLVGISVILSILVTYLCYSVLSPIKVWHISWLLFLFMPIIVSGIDLVIAIITDSKHIMLGLSVFIMIASSLLYVILGVTGFAPWHPTWLLPMVAAIVDVILLVLTVRFKLFGKK